MSEHGDGLILAIETSNPSSAAGGLGSVALGRPAEGGAGIEVVGERAVPRGRRHDDALMPTIAGLLSDHGASAGDLGRVAVSVGPGGFTGLRVSVTTAKMISAALGASLVGVPTARVAATAWGGAGRIAVALASKGSTAWVTLFDCGGAGVAGEEGAIMDADALAAAHSQAGLEVLISDAHLPAAMRAWASGAGVPIAPPQLSGGACLRASVGLSPVGVDALAPLYPREPEAVTKWRELHGS